MTVAPRHSQLVALVEASPWFMTALQTVRSLQLGSWCIGAGAVRNLVWDHLHGYVEPSRLPDVDVAYFNPQDMSPETDQALECKLEELAPDVPWEVTNQAGVHTWFEDCFGHPVQPLRSLVEAVASWPEYATCVGVALSNRGRIEIIAPWGLEDLFGLVVRRNPARVSLETYRQRTEQKRYAQRWPRVRVLT